jgi:HemY protein
MKFIFKIILLFALAIFVAILCSSGPGHVIMFLDGYRFDLSVTTLLIIVLIIYIILHYGLAIIAGIYNIPNNIVHYRQKMARIRNRSYFNQAATDYFLRNYSKAYGNALKSISQNVSLSDKFPVVLLAVDSIHLMNVDDKKQSAKIDRLISNFSTNEEKKYIYEELNQINKTKNSSLYAEILTKLDLLTKSSNKDLTTVS